MRRSMPLLIMVVLLAASCGGGDTNAPTATVSRTPIGQAAIAGAWSEGAPMPTARSEVTAAVLDRKIYVVGGFEATGTNTSAVEVYDPATDTWDSVAPLPIALDHAMAVARHGLLYVIGGYRVYDSDISSVTYEYDPSLDRWRTRSPLLLPRAAGAAVVVNDEVIYIIGGVGPEPEVVQAYNPEGASWQRLGALTAPREHLTAQVVDGTIYVIGGRWQFRNVDTVELYSTVEGSCCWRTGTPMPTARGGLASAVLDGRVHVFGGEDVIDRRTFAEHEVYDPATDRWTIAPPMPTARHGLAAQAVDGKIYVIGGGPQAALSTSPLVEVFSPGE